MQFYLSDLIGWEDPTNSAACTATLAAKFPQATLGLETVRFSIGSVLNNAGAETKTFRVQRDAAYPQSVALSIHGPYLDLHPASCDPAVRALTLRRFREACSAAACLQAKSVVFHTGWFPAPYGFGDWLENSVSFWRELLSQLPPEPPHIYIENVFEPDWRPLAELIDTLNTPAISVCLDVGHAATVSSLPVSDWITGLGGRIGWAHLHNNNGLQDLHAGLTDGVLPMKELIQLMVEKCPSASAVLEISDFETARRSLFWLKSEGLL